LLQAESEMKAAEEATAAARAAQAAQTESQEVFVCVCFVCVCTRVDVDKVVVGWSADKQLSGAHMHSYKITRKQGCKVFATVTNG
jgi:hypothetical protein